MKTLSATALLSLSTVSSAESPLDLALIYSRDVDRRLNLPAREQRAYAAAMENAFRAAKIVPLTGQYVVLVDRNPNVQAVMLIRRPATGTAVFIGASPASTGRPGQFEHFKTPAGVFAHSLDNLDFRSEGTENALGICGYGAQGMRVYDFGWVKARRTWDEAGESLMRLQMHSTDPRLLETRLGTAQSKGCIRIPASLNELIDRYGILDADYEQAMAGGRSFWVLHSDRKPTPWPGRYLVVVDSAYKARPAWSPLPPQH